LSLETEGIKSTRGENKHRLVELEKEAEEGALGKIKAEGSKLVINKNIKKSIFLTKEIKTPTPFEEDETYL
jgi:hypothetical protein